MKHAASDLVREEWGRRVEAEYRSAALTQHLCLRLIQIGASPDLVTLGLRIVRDELAHASLSAAVHARAGGVGLRALAEGSLELPRTPRPLRDDVVSSVVEIFCLGETVAVPLFSRMRRGCDVPVARRALDRILRDEVRHRDFGFLSLSWLLDGDPGIRAQVERELPAMLTRLRAAYGLVVGEVTRDDRRWGLLGGADYVETLERSLVRDHAPRFRKLGIVLDVS